MGFAYYSSRDESLPVYNGRFFYSYPVINNNVSPFYGGVQWQNGTICYDGTWYFDIPIRYDQVTDRVVVKTPRSLTLTLLPEHIQQFQLGSNVFVRLTPDKDHVLKEGFYLIVAEGAVTVLAKYICQLNKVINGNRVDLEIESFTYFYALKDGRYYPLKRAQSLQNLLKDKRQQLSQYLKEQHVRPKKEREKAIALMATFYNQLQH